MPQDALSYVLESALKRGNLDDLRDIFDAVARAANKVEDQTLREELRTAVRKGRESVATLRKYN